MANPLLVTLIESNYGPPNQKLNLTNCLLACIFLQSYMTPIKWLIDKTVNESGGNEFQPIRGRHFNLSFTHFFNCRNYFCFEKNEIFRNSKIRVSKSFNLYVQISASNFHELMTHDLWVINYDAFIFISFVQLLILMLLLVIAADWSAWIDHVTILTNHVAVFTWSYLLH